MDKTKSFKISKAVVLEAYKKVKANKGAAGIDGQSLAEFEKDLKNNLYKIWNRMSSGTYFPPAVKAVEIPKKSGGVRVLGIPTVADRVAQMVLKLYFEPKVEPHFLEDSYGYRPNKAAIDAVAKTRERCWKHDWVLEFDIKGLFDNISHELLMKAVRKHTDSKWEILYIERWLKAPFQNKNRADKERTSGTPQGGVISPVLANLFMHYAFDLWMGRQYPNNPWARYADDAVIHCKTKEQAEALLVSLKQRMDEIGLELHPEKTQIIYCKDDNRNGNYPNNNSFDFLGYTFRTRQLKTKQGKYFVGFAPAVSDKAMKMMRQTIRRWKIQLRTDKEIEDLSRTLNPIISGWINYYAVFNKSIFYQILKHINKALQKWVRRKYKKIAKSKERSRNWIKEVARRKPELFKHWKMGIVND